MRTQRTAEFGVEMFDCGRILIALGVWFIAFAPAQAQRSIPDDNLAYPVLIALGTSLGSGFYLNSNGKIFLVTAKHVLFDLQTRAPHGKILDLYSPSKDPNDDEVNHIQVDLHVMQSSDAIKLHPSQDVALIHLASLQRRTSHNAQHVNPYSMSPLRGVVILRTAKTGIVGVDLENIRTFDQVLVGNDLILYGYPSSLGISEQLKTGSFRPLLRKGIVAGKDLKTKTIILDCFSYPGNSGGPIIQITQENVFEKKFDVIGVITKFVPFDDQGQRSTFAIRTNSGYSIAAPMDAVLSLVRDE